MTDPSTPSTPAPHDVEAAIRDRLIATLTPDRLEVVNDSAAHSGHAGDDGSGVTHWTVRVESAAFAGLSRVGRQRLVNRALADLMDRPIHALAIEAAVPGEARPQPSAPKRAS